MVVVSILLILVTFFTLTACNKKKKKTKTNVATTAMEAPTGLTIENGEFFEPANKPKTGDSLVFPAKPKSWYTVSVDEKITTAHGIISLDEQEYKKYYSKWDKASSPKKWREKNGDKVQDPRVLLIYNQKSPDIPSEYKYSKGCDVEEYAYYKVSVRVYTKGDSVAILKLQDNEQLKCEVESTKKDEWQELVAYVEGSKSSSPQDFKITLANKGKGHAFFDSISMEKMDIEPENFQDDIVNKDLPYISYQEIDYNFSATSNGTPSKKTPYKSPKFFNYKQFEGFNAALHYGIMSIYDGEDLIKTKADSNATKDEKKDIEDTFNSYRNSFVLFEKGDTSSNKCISQENLEALQNLGKAGKTDGKFLYMVHRTEKDKSDEINNKRGGYYCSSFKVKLQPGKNYRFTTNVFAIQLDETGEPKVGGVVKVTLALSDGETKSNAFKASKEFSVPNDNAFHTISFVANGHPYKPLELYLAFSLGNGKDAGQASTAVLYDNYSFEETTDAADDSIFDAADFKSIDTSKVMQADNWEVDKEYVSSSNLTDDTRTIKIINEKDALGNNSEILLFENLSKTNSKWILSEDAVINVPANTLCFTVSMWIKLDLEEIDKDYKLIFDLLQKSDTSKVDKENAKQNFTDLNMEKHSLSKKRANNGYLHYSFNILNIKGEELKLQFALTVGEGSEINSQNLVKGKVYIANLCAYETTHEDYVNNVINHPSSTFIKSTTINNDNFGNDTISNYSFENIDLAESVRVYGIENKNLDENHILPASWNFTDKEQLKEKEVRVTTKTIADLPAIKNKKNNKVLELEALKDTKSFGVKANDSIDIKLNSVIKLSFWARVLKTGDTAYVYMGSETFKEKIATITSTDWVKYEYYIKTSFFKTNIEINLYIGDPHSKDKDAAQEGCKAQFDELVYQTYNTELTFETAQEKNEPTLKCHKIAIDKNKFDNTERTDLDISVNKLTDWKGSSDSTLKSGESEKDFIKSGAFNIDDYDYEQWTSDKNDIENTIKDLEKEIIAKRNAEIKRIKAEADVLIKDIAKIKADLKPLKDKENEGKTLNTAEKAEKEKLEKELQTKTEDKTKLDNELSDLKVATLEKYQKELVELEKELVELEKNPKKNKDAIETKKERIEIKKKDIRKIEILCKAYENYNDIFNLQEQVKKEDEKLTKYKVLDELQYLKELMDKDADKLKTLLAGKNNILFMYALKDYSYRYEMSNNVKLEKDSCYKITVDAATFNLTKGAAQFRLVLKDFTSPVVTIKDSEFKTYEIYIKTLKDSELSDVNILLSLGEKNNQANGIVFFDNVSIQKIELDAYETKHNEYTKLSNDKQETSSFKALTLEEKQKVEPEKKEKEEKTKPQNPLIWLYISSGILGALIIIVVIVVYVRKYREKKGKVAKPRKTKNKKARVDDRSKDSQDIFKD